jgi:PhzF family phenazine biosynthesis protein
MRLKLYQVDAFAERIFEGNPAAVCPLDAWLPDRLMQDIAAENNLSETAFFVKESEGYRIRWFTPTAEVDLCGHATLASAFVLWDRLGLRDESISFASRSGPLEVARRGDLLELDFPNQSPIPCAAPSDLLEAFGLPPGARVECLKRADYILVVGSQAEVVAARPNLDALRRLDLRGVALTAPGGDSPIGADYDFVSRFFAPRFGIDEDPATGSAFTQLAPYWSGRLGKSELRARQVSARGAEVVCRMAGDRVLISGKARLYLEGEILLP